MIVRSIRIVMERQWCLRLWRPTCAILANSLSGADEAVADGAKALRTLACADCLWAGQIADRHLAGLACPEQASAGQQTASELQQTHREGGGGGEVDGARHHAGQHIRANAAWLTLPRKK
jgi:hypothetical protein